MGSLSGRVWPLSVLSGMVAIGVYLSLSLVSYLLYPGPYGPLSNWLSDLGNVNVNVLGAVFYRSASLIAGLALIPFLYGLRRFYMDAGMTRTFLVLAQVSGIIGSFSLAMSGIFSIDNPGPHSFWSALLFIAFEFFLVFSGVAFLKRAGRMRMVSILAFTGAAVDFIFGIFYNTPLGEWLTVSLLLAYVGVLSYYLGRNVPGLRHTTR